MTKQVHFPLKPKRIIFSTQGLLKMLNNIETSLKNLETPFPRACPGPPKKGPSFADISQPHLTRIRLRNVMRFEKTKVRLRLV